MYHVYYNDIFLIAQLDTLHTTLHTTTKDITGHLPCLLDCAGML